MDERSVDKHQQRRGVNNSMYPEVSSEKNSNDILLPSSCGKGNVDGDECMPNLDSSMNSSSSFSKSSTACSQDFASLPSGEDVIRNGVDMSGKVHAVVDASRIEEEVKNEDIDDDDDDGITPLAIPTLVDQNMYSSPRRSSTRPKRTSQLLSRPASLLRVLGDIDEPEEMLLSSTRPKRTSQLLSRPASLLRVLGDIDEPEEMLLSPRKNRKDDNLIDGRYSKETGDDDDDDDVVLPSRAILKASVSLPVIQRTTLPEEVVKSSLLKPSKSLQFEETNLSKEMTSPNHRPKRTSILLSRPASIVRGSQQEDEPAVPEIMVAKTSDELIDGRRPSEILQQQQHPHDIRSEEFTLSSPTRLPGAYSFASMAPRNAKARRSATAGSLDNDSTTHRKSSNSRSPVRFSLPGNTSISLSSPPAPRKSPVRRSLPGNISPNRSPAPGAVSMSSPTPRNAKARRSAILDGGEETAVSAGAVGTTGPTTPRNAKGRRGGSVFTSQTDVGDVAALTPPTAGVVSGSDTPRNAKGRRGGVTTTSRVVDVGDTAALSPRKARRGGHLFPSGLRPYQVDNNNHPHSRSLQLAPVLEPEADSSTADVGAVPVVRSDLDEEMEYVDSSHNFDNDEILPGAVSVSARDTAIDELSVAAIPGFGVGAHHITNTDTLTNSTRYNSLVTNGSGRQLPSDHSDEEVVDAPVRRSLEHEMEATPTNKGSKKRGTVLIVLMCLLLLVGIIIAVAMTFSSKDTALETKSPAVETSPSPTNSPTAAPTSLARLMDFMDLVEPVSALDLLEIPNSPQRRALEWIAFQDPAQIEPNGSRSAEEIQERYIAALLYFTMGGENWLNPVSFLEGTSICAWNNGLEGVGIACENGNAVTKIKIEQNNLVGSIPAEICSFKHLEDLSLSVNRLTGEIPAEIGLCSNLKTLRLALNGLENQIPSTIVNLTDLRALELSKNKFIGTEFPSALLTLPRIEEILLGSNRLEGTIPSQIAELRRLAVLNVGSNFFSGTLPSEIGIRMPELIFLDFGLNGNLEGTIPPSFGSLTNLQGLHVHENAFTGTVPPQLKNLSKLQELKLHGNFFTGDIDPIFCDRDANDFIADLQADCDQNTPIQCNCCTDCY